jgi:hypothetical protein
VVKLPRLGGLTGRGREGPEVTLRGFSGFGDIVLSLNRKGQNMTKIVTMALFLSLLPGVALADMWMLVSSTVSGSNWICTYRSSDGQFVQTLIMPTGQMCPSYINH